MALKLTKRSLKLESIWTTRASLGRDADPVIHLSPLSQTGRTGVFSRPSHSWAPGAVP